MATRTRRSRRRPSEDEMDEVEEAPSRSRRRSREEPADEVEDEYEEDEQDDEPAPTKSKGKKSSGSQTPTIRDGWGGAQQTYDETSDYAQAFKLETDTKVLCFLSNRPYAGYSRHWVERVSVDDKGNRKKSNRPYICLDSVGMGECPVCDAGDKPQAVSSFNVAEINDDGTPFLKSWDVGIKLFNILKAYNNDRKVGPLDKEGLFFLVSRSGTGGSTNYQINPVSEDGLERADTLAPEDSDLAELEDKLYDKSILQIPSRKEMREIAAELSDYDDEYDN